MYQRARAGEWRWRPCCPRVPSWRFGTQWGEAALSNALPSPRREAPPGGFRPGDQEQSWILCHGNDPSAGFVVPADISTANRPAVEPSRGFSWLEQNEGAKGGGDIQCAGRYWLVHGGVTTTTTLPQVGPGMRKLESGQRC